MRAINQQYKLSYFKNLKTIKMSNTNNNSRGVGFFGLLTIAFIILKLTDVIDWSWWWVLAPTWIPVPLVLIGLLISWIVMIIKKSENKL